MRIRYYDNSKPSKTVDTVEETLSVTVNYLTTSVDSANPPVIMNFITNKHTNICINSFNRLLENEANHIMACLLKEGYYDIRTYELTFSDRDSFM